VFDYSWALLRDDERRMFRALSVFRGGFTRAAAEEVAGASVRGLAKLANKSFVIFDRDAGRYAIHELLRQYAEAELRHDQELWDATVQKHASYYADLTSEAEALMPLSNQKRALRLVEDDLDNIRWAWRNALATANAVAIRKLLVGLYFVYEIRGWYRAAVGLFGETLEALDAGAADEATQIARSAAAAVQAHFVGNVGRPDEGVTLASEAAERLAALPDRHAHLIALETQCELLSFGDNPEAVLAVSWEAIRLAEAHGLGWWAAGMRNYPPRSRSNWGTSRPPRGSSKRETRSFPGSATISCGTGTSSSRRGSQRCRTGSTTPSNSIAVRSSSLATWATRARCRSGHKVSERRTLPRGNSTPPMRPSWRASPCPSRWDSYVRWQA